MASAAGSALRPASLRFVDRRLEGEFRERELIDNLAYVRAAHVVAVAAWAFLRVLPRSS